MNLGDFDGLDVLEHNRQPLIRAIRDSASSLLYVPDLVFIVRFFGADCCCGGGRVVECNKLLIPIHPIIPTNILLLILQIHSRTTIRILHLYRVVLWGGYYPGRAILRATRHHLLLELH